MERCVEPELLDSLAPEDPRAAASRADLRRLNWVMGHASLMARALHLALRDPLKGRPGFHRCAHLVDLGAGDGRFLLSVARRLGPQWRGTRATLLDRHPLASAATCAAFEALGWRLEFVPADVFLWLRQSPAPLCDALVSNLFLHHFSVRELKELLRLSAARTQLFIALEPRRSCRAWAGSRLVALLGCKAVTRHDAPASVRAGFADHELSDLWPTTDHWHLQEQPAGLFTHLFTVRSNPI